MASKVIENKNKYVVFYCKWCKYSIRAIDLLKQKKLSYKSYDIDSIPGGMDALLENLIANKKIISFDVSHKTRPIIFGRGKFIGGYDDLVMSLKSDG
jgi:glutaredoxin